MGTPQDNTMVFENAAKYKIGNVTYYVSAHFDKNGETLKSKIQTLLIEEIRRKNSSKALAHSHSNSV